MVLWFIADVSLGISEGEKGANRFKGWGKKKPSLEEDTPMFWWWVVTNADGEEQPV